MRTSIPHGMSEPNRIHPFFIILRRYAEAEEVESRKMLKWFGGFFTMLVVTAIMLLVVINDGKGFLAGLPWLIIIAGLYLYLFIKATQEVRLILDNCSFPKVNQMLHSDDYATADLNYEKIYNMTCACADNVGEITILTRLFHKGFYVVDISTLVMAVIYVLQHVLEVV